MREFLFGSGHAIGIIGWHVAVFLALVTGVWIGHIHGRHRGASPCKRQEYDDVDRRRW